MHRSGLEELKMGSRACRDADSRGRLRRRAAKLAGCALVLALVDSPVALRAQNIIVVIVDDIGAEWFTAYGEQVGNPPTPTIDLLAARGVLFRSAWAYPICSPTRVSAFIGRHPAQHGVGHGINSTDVRDYVLAPSVPNLANLLRAAGYRTAAFGKWHMATELGMTSLWFYDDIISVTEAHPNLAGMQHFAGFLFGGANYFSWPKTVDGVTTWAYPGYATTDTTDGAIAALSGSEPFFLWVAFTASHGVFHDPPPELLADPSIYSGSLLDQYRAMTEAMDTELGRLLQQVDLTDTTVIFVADNGSIGTFAQPPRLSTHGKATVYEGGVRVPLIVAGQAVAAAAQGQGSDALVQATDLFPTVLELAGLTPPRRPDAISMRPYLSDPDAASLRQTAYTEMFTPNGGPIDPGTHNRAARGPRYKLIRNGTQTDEFYDLQLDPYELSPLELSGLNAEQQSAHDALDQAILARALADCENDFDDDDDGLVDAEDPGCDAASDTSERSVSLVCDDGLDNDGDSHLDYSPTPGSGDPGCFDPYSPLENPECQDGINNDPGEDARIDFDGGASVGVPLAEQTEADPQCMSAGWRDREAAPGAGAGCGIGPELSLLGLWLVTLRAPRRWRRKIQPPRSGSHSWRAERDR
jgi:arylsulfatase A-like enzyme